VLSLILIAAAVAKLSSWQEGPKDLLFALIALGELLAAAALVSGRYVRVALSFSAALALGGASQALLMRGGCSCFGSMLSLSWKTHVALCCGMGILVAIGWPSFAVNKSSENQEGEK
jgi:hypothetical protein